MPRERIDKLLGNAIHRGMQMLIGPGMLGDAVELAARGGIDSSTVTTLQSAATALDAAATRLDAFAPKLAAATAPGTGADTARHGAQLLTTYADDAMQRLIARGDRESMLIFSPLQQQQLDSVVSTLRELGL